MRKRNDASAALVFAELVPRTSEHYTRRPLYVVTSVVRGLDELADSIRKIYGLLPENVQKHTSGEEDVNSQQSH